jgi:cytochrome P450
MFGHDTAAAALAWAFVHIFQDRELVERLRAEVAGISPDQIASPDALPHLKACILESMRLCPVVVHLARTASADLHLGGFEIRRGEKVIPCTYLAQHNPRVFPDPYVFRPERFLNGHRYEHAYFPFGFGSRTCVGKPFALRQMLLVLAAALSSLDLELAPDYRPRPMRHLVLIVPQGGGQLRRRPTRTTAPTPVCTR